MPVSAASWGPEAPSARIVPGEGPGQRDTEPLCRGKMLCPLLGVFVRDSGNQAGVPQGILYPAWVVASHVQGGSEPCKVKHWSLNNLMIAKSIRKLLLSCSLCSRAVNFILFEEMLYVVPHTLHKT